MTVDLETGHYSYIAGERPLSSALAIEETWKDILDIHSADIIEEESRKDFRQYFALDTLVANLADTNVLSTRTIRALHRKDVETLPIIAMTANAMEEDKENALKSGINAHISKPLDMDVFLNVLRKYVS